MNRTKLVEVISAKTELTKKDADAFLGAFTEAVTEAICAGEKVNLVGFGSFEVRERAAREGRNPSTGEPMSIPATKVPAFKAGKTLKDVVNRRV